MYFLLEACENATILRIIYFGYIILQLVFTLLPIGLIVMLLVDFSKAVVMANDDKALKSTKIVTKRIIYAIIVFAIPWIVNVLMTILSSSGLAVGEDYMTCINNARSGDFSYYDKLEDNTSYFFDYLQEKTIGMATDLIAPSVLIKNATNEIGNGYQSKYDIYINSQPRHWCALFVTWNLKQIKYGDSTLYRYIFQRGSSTDDAACSPLMAYFMSHSGEGTIKFEKSKAYGGTYTPKVGDIVWFQWNGSSSDLCRNQYGSWNGTTACADHIGIVESVEGNVVHTIEGNVCKVRGCSAPTETEVMRVNRTMNDQIIAYGLWY